MTISKLAREIEAYKKDLKDKETLCKELEEKLACSEDAKKLEEDRQNKEKELIILRSVQYDILKCNKLKNKKVLISLFVSIEHRNLRTLKVK